MALFSKAIPPCQEDACDAKINADLKDPGRRRSKEVTHYYLVGNNDPHNENRNPAQQTADLVDLARKTAKPIIGISRID